MKHAILLLSLCGALAGAWLPPVHAATPTEMTAPTLPLRRANEIPNALLNAVKQNDFAALLEASEHGKDIATLAREWNEKADRHRAEKARRDVDRAELGDDAPEALTDDSMQQAWQKLQTDAGVELLVSELQPMIAEEAGKYVMQFNIAFGATLTGIASEKDFSADQVQQLTQLMYAVQDWTGRVQFDDPARLHRALQAVAQLVRQTGLKRFDDTQTIAFEDAIVHGDSLIRTVKQVLAAYDLDADEILNSVRLSEIDAVDDRATLRVEARVFGVPLTHDFKQQYFEGEWMDVETVASITRWREQETEESDVAEAAVVLDEVPAAAAAPAQASAESCSPKNEFADDPETAE
jgi:hypothetical protein